MVGRADARLDGRRGVDWSLAGHSLRGQRRFLAIGRGGVNMTKYFTVEEANRTLPLVRRIVTDIVAAHGERVARIKEYGHLDHGLSEMNSRRQELDEELKELTDRINGFIEELEGVGALFKGFDPGLVDFYAMMDDRPVFLCWKLGETKVEFWHEIEAGFAGRQRVPQHLAPRDEENEVEEGEGVE
jgi:hypothetical protein